MFNINKTKTTNSLKKNTKITICQKKGYISWLTKMNCILQGHTRESVPGTMKACHCSILLSLLYISLSLHVTSSFFISLPSSCMCISSPPFRFFWIGSLSAISFSFAPSWTLLDWEDEFKILQGKPSEEDVEPEPGPQLGTTICW